MLLHFYPIRIVGFYRLIPDRFHLINSTLPLLWIRKVKNNQIILGWSAMRKVRHRAGRVGSSELLDGR
jgi:hypothetical protein